MRLDIAVSQHSCLRAWQHNMHELRVSEYHASGAQRKSFDLLIYADCRKAIEREVRLRTKGRETAKYFQSCSFTPEVLALSHLALPTPDSFLHRGRRPCKPYPLAPSPAPMLTAYESTARKITKFSNSSLKSSRQFCHFFVLLPPILCFSVACRASLTAPTFAYS